MILARKKKLGRPKGENPPRQMIASFRGTPTFEAWFDGLVEHIRKQISWNTLPKSAVIERALICLAREVDYEPSEPPAEER